MFLSSVGVGSGADGQSSATEAFQSAQLQLGEVAPNAAIVYAASTFDQAEVLSTIKASLPEDAVILGGSTAGEISHHGPASSPSVVVTLLASDTVHFHAAAVTDAATDPLAKGAALAQQLQEQATEPIKLAIICADGLTVDPGAIVSGMNSQLPNTQIVGGSAGDNGHYKQTYQYHNGQVLSSSVTALALTGKLRVSIGVRHGWSPISGFRTVTKSDGAIIHEIDGQPAIALYEEFLGETEAAHLKGRTLAELALSYPLGVKDAESSEMLLRAPFYVDEHGSITCGGQVPTGSEVQLMMGTKENAVQAAHESAARALDELGKTPLVALVFSCHVRNTLFASLTEAKLEIDGVRSAVGESVPMAGFYTYAEQAPVNSDNINLKTCNSVNHNETIVTILIAEDNE